MVVVLVFHFRDDASGSRQVAFDATRVAVVALYPFNHVLVVDSGHEPYSRAASRNLGVRQAEGLGADVVVLNDADSIPEAEPLKRAIEESYNDGLIHHPFNTVWSLIPKSTKRIGNTPLGQLRNRAISRSGPSQGGIWVCRPDVWWGSGGQDERFTGYGAEDRAHLAATNTILGQSVIHEGVLLCAYHDRQLGTHETWDYNDVELLTRYHNAFGDAEALRKITEEWRAI